VFWRDGGRWVKWEGILKGEKWEGEEGREKDEA